MRFERPLTQGRLLRRYKRFFADVRLTSGRKIVAHCANPGSMLSCAPPGARVWLSESDKPGRKLRYTWELVRASGSLVCVNTAWANRVVAEALERGRIAELASYSSFHREIRTGKSRLDFLLGNADDGCFVEVKMVTLSLERGVAAFPDSVTERGTRHLEELIKLTRRGRRTALLFCCARSKMTAVRPAEEIDPRYARTLRRAAASGVEILAYRCRVTPRQVTMVDRIDVRL